MLENYLETMLEGTDISINFCRQNAHSEGETFAHGKTPDLDLIAVTEGGYEYGVDGRSHQVHAGEIFLVPEGCYFTGLSLARSAHYYCHFSINTPLRMEEGKQFEEEVRRIFFNACRKENNTFLLACVIRIVLYQHALAGHVKPSSDIPAGILAAVERMRAHPEQNISAVELANIADLSYGYFFKSFRRAMGVSPILYRDQLRLHEAKQMLLAGRSVKETAAALHFADMFTFSKRFKQLFHVSPSQMRILNAQKE